jgi:hypothetical protein
MGNKLKSGSNYFQRIDQYLSNGNHLFLVVHLLSVIYFFIFYPQGVSKFYANLTNIPLSVGLAASTVWFYLSTRKYGYTDTTVFYVFLPLYIFFAFLSKISPSKNNPNTKHDYTDLESSFTDLLNSAINEIYEGKVIEHIVENDSIVVTFQVPYGIKIPQAQIIHQISPGLHISEKNIIYSELTSRKTQYMITPKGIQEYDEYKKLNMKFNTFTEIKARIRLQQPTDVLTQK